MDQLVPDLLKLGPPGLIIVVLLWVVRFLFNWGEDKSKQLIELSKVSQEADRRSQALIAELTPILRDHTAIGEDVRELLREMRERGGRRR